jgi:chromosome segregation ATPase
LVSFSGKRLEMNAAAIAEVTGKIDALEQDIKDKTDELKAEKKSVSEILTLLAPERNHLTALINRRERLEQQQASAGKFLFIYFPLGYLYINHSR